MCNCADCSKWYRLHEGVIGECRRKASQYWQKTVLYNNTCEVGMQG